MVNKSKNSILEDGKNSKVSVIIPLYNAEEYISDCIDSILNQTYTNFEIVIINDGSKDNSEKIVEGYKKKDKRIKLYTIENNGAGYARNYALKKVTGKYVMFVDGDDFIEPVTLEVAVKRIEEDNSDFVYFDYKYYFEEDSKYRYTYSKNYNFFKYKTLDSEDRMCLLKIKPHYSVNKLYRKAFLDKNSIRYGEHHIYEDSIFWTKCILMYNKVSLIHSPLYNIRVTDVSSTKTKHDTDYHAKSFLASYDETIVLFDDEQVMEKKIFVRNIVKRFIVYYYIRTPKKYQKMFLDEFYKRLSSYGITKVYRRSLITRVLRKLGISKTKFAFRFYIWRKYKKYRRETLKQRLRKMKLKTKHAKKTVNRKAYEKYNESLQEQVLFMGFDYRYTGNSRYLYEKMLKNKSLKIYFATKDELVSDDHRVEPGSKEFYEKLYSSKIVIFESWISKHFKRPENAVWINLWHGTPLKKMLFDSNEFEILTKNPRHKVNKYGSLSKTNYLLTDNKNVNRYFESSFLFDKDRILSYGYPRVEYLIENKDNIKLKKEIREKLGIEEDKKIVMYLPTWRDYNYDGEAEFDFGYFLDIKKLREKLPDNYEIFCKDHAFLRRNEDLPNVDIETQELLLVSDYLITDYSSIMFDAFAIDLPVCIISKDYDKYSLSRGLYEDMWNDLKPFVVYDEENLAKLIKKYKIDDSYKFIKNKYCYKSDGDLVKFIEEQLRKGNN